ncbi:N(4)-(beta-N-acetylglucosaminyl)-L-asparaginase [Vibrio sp. DW001]|uniref:N(4)-(beta-N-acetylglucosaminyl)-L-asparaginase n=1 Tax=unclassified Vibrio TaxID=2614977 RepID=UPI0023AFF30C|nr:N(4)-(beta-N-acetylglucosaminyl)-L-asparaginase [Vibrio sp. DW001]WED29372.1 N(4)-(beta-N-acetylglucosaminyl)-L-asparaginase [Vibrio sp. DW001]
MIVLSNSEAWPGIDDTARMLDNGDNGLDAIIHGIEKVEAEPSIRSVGYGGWPNLLGDMEFDGAVMDGDSLRTGAVGAVKDHFHITRVARKVMEELNHEILVGEGATRFANEMGFSCSNPLLEDSKQVWWKKLQEIMGEENPDLSQCDLAPLNTMITDPEKVRDTTVFLTKDNQDSIYSATSTSGWAWKYPGRLGDSPIVGAGFYADSRYGAAACTHTGEMTIRANTSYSIVMAMRLGYSLQQAVELAIEELVRLKGGFLGGVVIHAIDNKDNHRVVNVGCEGDIIYWVYKTGMDKPQECIAEKY